MENKIYDDFGHEITVGMLVGFNKTINGYKCWLHGQVVLIENDMTKMRVMIEGAEYVGNESITEDEKSMLIKKIKDCYSIKTSSKFYKVEIKSNK